jgi:hypothetical protein
MARETGLEPATSGVTGRRSNQLSYSPREHERIGQPWAQVKDGNRSQIIAADPTHANPKGTVRIGLSPMTSAAFRHA